MIYKFNFLEDMALPNLSSCQKVIIFLHFFVYNFEINSISDIFSKILFCKISIENILSFFSLLNLKKISIEFVFVNYQIFKLN